jgi:hypothetical protein
MFRSGWIALSNFRTYRVALLAVVSATVFMSSGCAPSADRQREVRSFIERYAREWQQVQVDKIYQTFDSTFKRIYPTLEDCVQWKRSVDQRWGDLRTIDIVKISQLALIKQPYLIETKMTYEKGETSGLFTIVFRDQGAYVARVVMANAPEP